MEKCGTKDQHFFKCIIINVHVEGNKSVYTVFGKKDSMIN